MQGNAQKRSGTWQIGKIVLQAEGNVETEELLGTHSGILSDRCSICSIRVCRIKKKTHLKSNCFSALLNYFLIITHVNVRKSVNTKTLKHKHHLRCHKITTVTWRAHPLVRCSLTSLLSFPIIPYSCPVRTSYMILPKSLSFMSLQSSLCMQFSQYKVPLYPLKSTVNLSYLSSSITFLWALSLSLCALCS